MSRPTLYTEDLADDLCSRIAEGNSLSKVCLSNDMPSTRTVYTWLRLHEKFLHNYTRAKDDSADADADRIEEIAEKVVTGEIEPANARVAIDAYKWTAGKKKPKRYGDRQKIVTDDGQGNDAPVGSIDVSKLSDSALKELINLSNERDSKPD